MLNQVVLEESLLPKVAMATTRPTLGALFLSPGWVTVTALEATVGVRGADVVLGRL